MFALLAIVGPARHASAAILQQVQSGTVTSTGNGITSVTISSIDTTKSVLIFQTRTDSGMPGGSTVRGRLQSSTSIEFQRVTTETAPIRIQWYLATFGSGVTVQRGEVAQSNTTVNVAITSVGSMSQAFVLFSKTAASGEAEWSNDDAVAGDLTTTTNLQFRSGLLNAAHIISWQVVRFTTAADINVQRGSITTMTGAATSVTATLSPAVNLGKTFVLASWRTTGTGVDAGSRMLRARLTSSTQITIDRSVSGSPDDINEIWWQVIELKDASTVWSGNASFASGAPAVISPLGLPDTNIDRAVGFLSGQGGAGQSMGRSPYVASDVIGVANATVSFTNNQVTLERTNTAATADVAWFVVQFDGGPPFKVGSFTKSAATGTQTIAHGLGQKPKAMLFWAEGASDDITLRGAQKASTDGAVSAIVQDAIVSGDRGTNGTTVTTTAFSTSFPDELLLAFVSAGSGTVNTVSGGGLTWELVKRTNIQTGTAEIWRAFSTTTLSNVAVTANLSASTTSSITVMTCRGVDTSGTNGSGAIGATQSASSGNGAPTATLTTTRDGSGVGGVGTDTENNVARTVGTNQSLVHQYMPGNNTYWVQAINAPVPAEGTLARINDTAPNNDRYNLTIVEILAALPALTINVPAGTVADDVMIATIDFRSNTAVVTPPAGWTQVRRTNNANTSAHSLVTYSRVATAGEPASYSWTFDATAGAVGSIVSFAGVDTANPINVENGQNTGNSFSHQAPAVTTTVAKTMIVTAHSFSTSGTWSAPAGLTEAVDVASLTVPDALGVSMSVNYGIRAAAGLTPAYTATAAASAGFEDVGNTHTLALRPASRVYYSLGMTDGATSRSVSSSSDNGVATTNASSRTAAKAITIVRSTVGGGAVRAEADLVAGWDSTNFQLNWTTNDGAATVVHYIAFGGTDLSAKVIGWTTGTGTGMRAVTGVGFQPNLVFHAHAGAQQVAGVPSTMANGALGFGVMSAEGDEWANGFLTLDNAATSDAQRGQQTDAFLYAFDQNLAVQKKASFVSMDANGFTADITTAASANDMQVFSLALSGLNATVGRFTKSVAAQPASQAITGVGFKPGAVLFTSVQDVTQAAPVAHARFGLGASDGTTDGASTFEDLDASATSDVGGTDKATKAFIKVNNSTSTVNAEADVTTMGVDGFTLNWTTNDAVATEILYLALGPMAVTEVTMISKTATTYPSGVLVEWATGYERDNLGFNVYREVDGIRTKVNGSPITGSGLQAGPGHPVNGQQSYARWDLGAAALTAAAYWVEDLDFNGTSTLHGPIAPTVGQLQDPSSIDDSGELDDINDDTYYIRRIFVSEATDPGDLGPRVAEPQLPQEVATQWELAAASGAVKIGIRKPGWYRVRQADLVANGLSALAERQKLQLFVNGIEQAIRVSGGTTGTFSSADAIEFYASGADTAYTDTRIYWLRAGDQDGQRIGLDTVGTFDPSALAVFSSRLKRKDRGVYFDALNNGDTENWFGPTVEPSAPATLTLTPNHVDLTNPAQLTVKLQGVTVSSSAPHNVGVTVNGIGVGVMTFDGHALAEQTFVVPAGLVTNGENTVRLDAPAAGDTSLVDSIALDYPHFYQADADRLRFVVDGPASIAVDGFASPSIRVFDITNREAPVQLQTTIVPASGLSTVTVQVSGSGRRTLIAFSEQTVLLPEFVRQNHPSSLHASSNHSEYVVVSHADFIPALAPLVTLHQTLDPIVVDVEDVYDEFSFGQKTPQAIRDFLQWSHAKWTAPAPRFVVLAGDATVDPRDYSGRGNVDFVPTKAVPMTQKTGEMPSDDWFVDYNDDGLPDTAIGRLSIRTAEQAEAVVAKIVSYDVNYDSNSQQPWTKEVLLVADRTDGTTDFEQATGALGALMPAGYTAHQLPLRALGSVAAHDALVNNVNAGQLIVNYSGHGSVGRWSDGFLLNADVASWTNAQLPFVVAMNCLSGLFNQSYDEQSIAEALQRAEHGGAVAVWASSTDTAPATQALVNQELLRLIFAGTYSTLGEAVAAAKAVVANQDLRRSWIFFGDPAMRLAGQFPVAAGPAPSAPPPPHPYVEDGPPAPITDPADPAPEPPPPAPAPNPAPASGPAAPAPAETQPPVAVAPGAPSSLSSSVFGSTLVLTWAAPVSGGAAGWYVVEAGSFAGSRDFVQSTGNLSTTFTAEGVAAGTYFVRVRAASAAGEGAASNEVIVVVGAGSAGPQGSGAPAPPRGLVASVSGSSVTFAWNRSTLGGAAQTYWIDAGSSSGLSDLASFSTGNAGTVVLVPGVPAGTYYVRVRAANGAGTSGSSNEVVVFVGGSSVCAVPPDAPAGLRSTVAGSTVVLGWNGSAGSPTSYIIEAASQPGAADLLVSDTGSTLTAMIASNVGSGTYYVRVFARNACGVSGASNEIVVVVP